MEGIDDVLRAGNLGIDSINRRCLMLWYTEIVASKRRVPCCCIWHHQFTERRNKLGNYANLFDQLIGHISFLFLRIIFSGTAI